MTNQRLRQKETNGADWVRPQGRSGGSATPPSRRRHARNPCSAEHLRASSGGVSRIPGGIFGGATFTGRSVRRKPNPTRVKKRNNKNQRKTVSLGLRPTAAALCEETTTTTFSLSLSLSLSLSQRQRTNEQPPSRNSQHSGPLCVDVHRATETPRQEVTEFYRVRTLAESIRRLYTSECRSCSMIFFVERLASQFPSDCTAFHQATTITNRPVFVRFPKATID